MAEEPLPGTAAERAQPRNGVSRCRDSGSRALGDPSGSSCGRGSAGRRLPGREAGSGAGARDRKEQSSVFNAQ